MSALLSIVENPACHCAYFDNFSTSFCLLRYLHKRNFRALGTIREDRTTKCPLRPSKSVEKEKRGFFEHRSDDYVSIVQWKDYKVVCFGSNFSNIEPTKMMKRYSQGEKKKISCVQPFCFYQYNHGMGGVNLLDKFISQYRPTIQTKKRYWPLFVNCIEMLTVAAWRLHVTLGTSPRLDFLEFIQSVVGGWLKTTSSASSGPNRKRIINTSVGLHHPVHAETQGRCSNCKKCQECGVHLHPMCFLDHHN